MSSEHRESWYSVPDAPDRSGARSRHLFRWTARRARKRWLSSARGHDAYVYPRQGLLRWEVSYLRGGEAPGA